MLMYILRIKPPTTISYKVNTKQSYIIFFDSIYLYINRVKYQNVIL